jgi:hypothetical protein
MRRLGIIAYLVVPTRAGAQLPPVGVPGGVVRVELEGSLETYDRRFRNGTREGYAVDLTSSALGGDRIPALTDADARIGRITGNAANRINLGAVSADALVDVGTGFFGLSLGLTNHITIFGRIPLVRARVQPGLVLSASGANAGFSPDPTAQGAFFTEFDNALSTLSAKLAAGDYDGDPARRALAEATLADGTALRADLFGLLADPPTASPVLPIEASTAGSAVRSRVTALQTTLATNLDVPGFSLTPALPTQALTDTELEDVLTSPAGPIAAQTEEESTTFRGDAEAGASLTLIDRWDRDRRRGGFRAAVSALVRFPTGRLDRTDHPLDVGSSEGQTDVQVDVTTDLGSGPLGARLSGTYVRQLPSDVMRRVTSPSQPFAGPSRLARVRRDPGDVLAIGAKPFYRVARTFALQAGVEHWSRTSDEVSYASPADALPGIDASVLALESRANATVLSLGVTYANPAGLRPGGRGLPVDAVWSYERVLRAGGGRVPNAHTVRARLRIYFGVW